MASQVPWKFGGLAHPSAAQPPPEDGPFMVEYRAPDGTKVRAFIAEWTDADPADGEVEIPWESVDRWVSLRAIP
jgi:hypothetical protein